MRTTLIVLTGLALTAGCSRQHPAAAEGHSIDAALERAERDRALVQTRPAPVTETRLAAASVPTKRR